MPHRAGLCEWPHHPIPALPQSRAIAPTSDGHVSAASHNAEPPSAPAASHNVKPPPTPPPPRPPQFCAIVNINLAVVNTLPLPALDGGYLLLLVIEGLRGKKLPEKVEQVRAAAGPPAVAPAAPAGGCMYF